MSQFPAAFPFSSFPIFPIRIQLSGPLERSEAGATGCGSKGLNVQGKLINIVLIHFTLTSWKSDKKISHFHLEFSIFYADDWLCFEERWAGTGGCANEIELCFRNLNSFLFVLLVGGGTGRSFDYEKFPLIFLDKEIREEFSLLIK